MLNTKCQMAKIFCGIHSKLLIDTKSKIHSRLNKSLNGEKNPPIGVPEYLREASKKDIF